MLPASPGSPFGSHCSLLLPTVPPVSSGVSSCKYSQSEATLGVLHCFLGLHFRPSFCAVVICKDSIFYAHLKLLCSKHLHGEELVECDELYESTRNCLDNRGRLSRLTYDGRSGSVGCALTWSRGGGGGAAGGSLKRHHVIPRLPPTPMLLARNGPLHGADDAVGQEHGQGPFNPLLPAIGLPVDMKETLDAPLSQHPSKEVAGIK